MGQTEANLFHEQSYRVEVDEKVSYLFWKRTMDMVASLIGILLLSPIYLLVSLFIIGEDPKGGIIFKQVRVGKNGKLFGMYKFRSMVSNAEELLAQLIEKNEASGHMFKMKEDPRVTRVGRFIRKTSIDELPQLFNVLKGDMSLVGPRPPLEREVIGYNDYHKQRLLVTPGCTGLWQVSGRSSIGFEEMVELDLCYIRKRSLGMDTKLILKTILVLFGSKDAY